MTNMIRICILQKVLLLLLLLFLVCDPIVLINGEVLVETGSESEISAHGDVVVADWNHPDGAATAAGAAAAAAAAGNVGGKGSTRNSSTTTSQRQEQKKGQYSRYDLLILICTQSFTGEELVEEVLVDALAGISGSGSWRTKIALVDESGLDFVQSAEKNSQMDAWTLPEQSKVVLVVAATYGDGDPPNHATEFADWLEREAAAATTAKGDSADTTGNQQDGVLDDNTTTSTGEDVTYYSVFGLGDSSYAHFGAFGIYVDEKLRRIPHTRELVPLQLGNVLEDLQGSFVQWSQRVAEALGNVLPTSPQPNTDEATHTTRTALYTSTGTDWRRSALDPASVTATLTKRRNLLNTSTSSNHDRSVLHVSLTLPTTTRALKPGDYAGLYPHNPPHMVQRAMDWLFLHDKTTTKLMVKQPYGGNLWKETTVSAWDFLQRHVDLAGRASPSTLRALVPFVGTLSLRALARELTAVETVLVTTTNHSSTTTTTTTTTASSRSLSRWDLWSAQQNKPYMTKLDLTIYFECRPSLQALSRALGPLQPRLYSIATVSVSQPAFSFSQPELDVGTGTTTIGLCMAVVDHGLCTNYIATLPLRSPVSLYTRSNPGFHYDCSTTAPPPTYWMAAGSGMGPYIGFLQQERLRDSVDLSHIRLLVGSRTPADVLYQDELDWAKRHGAVVEHAFSRVFGQPKKYVSQLLVERSQQQPLLYEQLATQQGRLYVCGRLELCQAAEHTLIQMALLHRHQGGNQTTSLPQARAWVQSLQDQGRFRTDCWSVVDTAVVPTTTSRHNMDRHRHLDDHDDETTKPIVVSRLARHYGTEQDDDHNDKTPNDETLTKDVDVDIESIPAWPSYLRLLATGELERRVHNATAMHSACVACGRFCEVDRLSQDPSDWGECRVGEKAIVYAHDAHFGEEDCLKGTHGSGTIFFGACNLKCIYCQNWKLSMMDQGELVTPDRLADMMLELQSWGCHNINFVSPTHNVLAILQGIFIAAKRGLRLPLVWNTGGYDSVASLRLLEGIFDIYMPDAKYASRKVARKLSRIDNYPEINQAAIKEMHRQVGALQIDPRTGLAYRGVLVRHLVLPQDYAGTMDVASFLVNEVSADTYTHVMDYYRPEYEAANDRKYGLNRKPTRQELQQAHERARMASLHRIHGENPQPQTTTTTAGQESTTTTCESSTTCLPQ